MTAPASAAGVCPAGWADLGPLPPHLLGQCEHGPGGAEFVAQGSLTMPACTSRSAAAEGDLCRGHGRLHLLEAAGGGGAQPQWQHAQQQGGGHGRHARCRGRCGLWGSRRARHAAWALAASRALLLTCRRLRVLSCRGAAVRCGGRGCRGPGPGCAAGSGEDRCAHRSPRGPEGETQAPIVQAGGG